MSISTPYLSQSLAQSLAQNMPQGLGHEAPLNPMPLVQSPERLTESGILIVDKPKGITSMDVIRVLKKVTHAAKIGHGGTLDPLATGVLPILFNRATRLSDQVMIGEKEYEGVLILGQAFDTQDVTGRPLFPSEKPTAHLEIGDLQAVTKQFVGEILQTPPMFSAVKRNGKPLYHYARKGVDIAVEPRKVSVERFEITERLDEKRFKFLVRSKKGVYVRTLVHDLGEVLGVGAALEELRRLQTGPFHIDEAVRLSTLLLVSDIKAHLKSMS